MNGCVRRSSAVHVVSWLAILSLASGCAFRTLKKDIEEARELAAAQLNAALARASLVKQ